eukprot:CAMPEP_0118701580 /NCGR_PEP_ID=MMETSP0800-20121206/17340_1 /TAXON_ID=210618 ORGANISM="Striatella unipunctata, Strain CCMP2910" /NCGR_SAMPLE_ID=MMETSP0800 /ASSEMBLY_ACC=CAM_ASM_000638 /LENGTH=85 /DNA_ID=CAMNT_0006602537 /DNA_START=110 /DNA_END=367 /DNA_ORIENTATION=-
MTDTFVTLEDVKTEIKVLKKQLEGAKSGESNGANLQRIVSYTQSRGKYDGFLATLEGEAGFANPYLTGARTILSNSNESDCCVVV